MKYAPAKVHAPRKTRRWLRPRVFAYAMLAAVPVGLIAVWVTTALLATSVLRKAGADADRLDPGWRFGDLLAKRAIIPEHENSALRVLAVLAKLRGGFPTPVMAPLVYKPDILARLSKVTAPDRLDDAMAAAIRRELRAIAPAIVEARKLAVMPRGRSDPNYKKLLWSTLLDHVQNSRSVARLMVADAALRAHDGDPDGALESCRACVNVGRSIGDEPFLISQLVRIAYANLALSAAERAVNQGEPCDDAMAKLQALLLDEADQPLALIGMRGERAMIDDIFSKLATGEVTFREIQGTAGSAPLSAPEFLASASGAFVRYNYGLAIGRMNEAVEIAKRPHHEQPALWDDWDKRAVPTDSVVAQLASSLSRETLPSVAAYNNALIRIRGQLLAMATLLAAERHRLAYGAFPDRIEAIDAKFLPRGLLDPFSGGPLCFKSDGEGGLIVYSVSHDRTDDGGEKLELKKWTQKGFDLGYRLRAPKWRARPPKIATLPEDVFRHDPKAEDEGFEEP